jgi:type II secretory pathway pseudopilin PulG
MSAGKGQTRGPSRGPSLGFTYLALLIVVAITAGALAAAGGVWSHSAQRENERELLFVGEQFRQAISAYYWKTPGGAHQYPKSLEALLEDQRWPTTQRWLRKLYRDPITNSSEWGVIEAPGNQGIMGVYSKSEDVPIKSAGFPARLESFAEARSYADWKFVFVPETPTVPAQQAGR